MSEPRPEKVAVVAEVREKFAAADAAVLTDYRGLDVPSIAQLRRLLREAGGEYKIYKNTLVRFAVRELGLEIEDLLVGPTAIAFVGDKADGSPGDAAAVAKALKDFARTNDSLVLKGGVLDDKILTVEELRDLADLPPRDVLLAQLAGAFQAPLAKFAGLLQALPRDFAYGLQALIDKLGGAPATAEPAETEDTEAAEPAETEDTEAAEPAETEDTEAAEPAETEDTEAAVPAETEDTAEPSDTEESEDQDQEN
jgi:large subunit ribosomal protein L10